METSFIDVVANFTNNRKSLVYHELRENFLRTAGNGMSYPDAHSQSQKMRELVMWKTHAF